MPAQRSKPLGIFQRVLIGVIWLYRYTLSGVLGGQCRFVPSCSAYGLGAVEVHGAMHGGWLTAKRICRCHPWQPGGHDPVPECTK